MKFFRNYCTGFIGLFQDTLWVVKVDQRRKPGCAKVELIYLSSDFEICSSLVVEIEKSNLESCGKLNYNRKKIIVSCNSIFQGS
jgi:hypothetical protein